tara:strand:- start:95 stop:229 length:135 start_codon:yes stop_codon:yes gene_type:complete
MSSKEKRLKLAYKAARRMSLLPFLDEEIEAVFLSLNLVRKEDIE